MNMHIIAYCRKQMQFANRRLQRYNLELMNDDINFMGNGIRLVIHNSIMTHLSFIYRKESCTTKLIICKMRILRRYIYNITFCMELQNRLRYILINLITVHVSISISYHIGKTSERTWTLVRGGSGGWEWRGKLSHQVEWQVPIIVVLSLTSEWLPTAEGT